MSDQEQEAAVTNRNATIAPEEYNQPFDRTLFEGASFLQDEFFQSYNGLQPGDAWIDGGSGLELGLLQAAVERGVHTIATNAQDFWATITPQAHVPLSRLNAIATALCLSPFPASEQETKTGELTIWKEQLFETLQIARQSGLFKYLVGRTEDLLPHLPLAPSLKPSLKPSMLFFRPWVITG